MAKKIAVPKEVKLEDILANCHNLFRKEAPIANK